MARPNSPTGITIEAFSNSIRVQWRANDSADIRGYNIYNSQTSGGGLSGYTRLNDELIQIFDKIVRETESSTETITEAASVRTTTVTENLEQVTYFAYTHDNLEEAKEQYYVITAVNNNGEESLYSAEISEIPLVIDTDPVEVPRKTKSEVILSYLDEIRRHDSRVDTKPGTPIRDLHIDPHGVEFEYAYILLDFNRKSSSFLSLRAFDDADNDRISDDVSDSEDKIALRRALGYNDDGSEDESVQNVIDGSFDALASNSGTVRKPATKSQGEATFYSTTPPSDDVTIAAGEIISTTPGQNTPAVNFKTLATAVFLVSQSESYFDSISQRYEMTVAIEALGEGTLSNVAANTIINTTVSDFDVTNELSTFGGKEQESNADLADRALLAYRSLDVGTINGYTRNVIEIHNVEDVEIIDAGHILMHRDYDEVRQKHVYGKVDIYFQGEELEEFTEKVGFLYDQVEAEEMTILGVETPTSNLLLQTINAETSSTKPIFIIDSVRNVTQGIDYDVLGNVSIYKDGIYQDKGRFEDVEVNMETGELIFSTALTSGQSVTARYDSYVEAEVVIETAVGGEVNASLDNTGDDGIREESYVIYKNDVAMTETTEYTLNLITGVIAFITPLSTGDKITADYAYIINPEIVIATAVGGERSLFLANPPIYPSVQVINGTDIEINRFNEINQLITTLLTDVIRVTYRYRNSSSIVLENQPVRSISSVIGTSSGSLVEGTHYDFNRKDDVILDGNSVRAQRSILPTYNQSDGFPAGTINNSVENIILSGTSEKELTNKGIIEDSIIVQNLDRSVTYIKNVDYQINITDETEPVYIQRVTGSSIVSGQTVIVDYNYGEILTIKYVVNNLVKKVQDNIDEERHITADVLVKESPQTKVDITLSIKLTELAEASATKNAVITAISDEINQKKMGQNVYKSDIIRAVDNTAGVDYVILPMTKMVKADDSIVVREKIDANRITWALVSGTTQTWITSLKFEDENPTSNGSWTVTTAYSGIVNVDSNVLNVTTGETYTYVSHTTNTVTLAGITPPLSTDVLELTYYVRTTALVHKTLGNSGNTTQAYGVFENDEELTLVDTEVEVDSSISQAIIASDGAVLISPKNVINPNGTEVRVTYFIYGEDGENDIVISDIEHLDPGTITVLIA